MDLEFNNTHINTATSEPRPIPHGISPALLLEQVRNTVPFIFGESAAMIEARGRPGGNRRFLEVLRAGAEPEDTAAYFELCLSAHHGTVASFVPTDVDNQIRFRLWDPTLERRRLERMFDCVEESLNWDSTCVSERWLRSPVSGEVLSGHQGEWFSTAAAAYGAFRKRDGDRAARMAGLVIQEMRREAQVLEDFLKAGDGIGVLKCATILAHNLGDFDRVIEQWNIPEEDALRQAAYKAGHENKPLFPVSLKRAGELNKAVMADENHRHFALRRVKPLRRHRDFLLGLGPFFDDWGLAVARHPELEPEEIAETVQALIDGWNRLGGKAQGYVRALAGIEQGFAGGVARLRQYLPAKAARILKAGDLRARASIPRGVFERQWAQNALQYMNR